MVLGTALTVLPTIPENSNVNMCVAATIPVVVCLSVQNHILTQQHPLHNACAPFNLLSLEGNQALPIVIRALSLTPLFNWANKRLNS